MRSSGLPARRIAQTTPPGSDLATLLGPPPVLKSEDVDAYNELHDHVRRAVAPACVIDEIFVRDIVDLTWEVHRLRSLKVALLTVRRSHGLYEVLEAMGVTGRDAIATGWYYGRVAAVRKVDKLLARVGLDRRAIDAETLACNLEEIDRFDRMITQAENRRNAALRELDRHRAALVRQALAEIEDAEFEDIASSQADSTASDQVHPDQIEGDSRAGHATGVEEADIGGTRGDEGRPIELPSAGGNDANEPKILERDYGERYRDLEAGYR